MGIIKRPIVVKDLIELATYIADGNIDVSDNFLLAAEKTFVRLGNFPRLGKSSKFTNPDLANIRQKAIKGSENYLIFYQLVEEGIEIVRVIHGSRNIENILESELDENS